MIQQGQVLDRLGPGGGRATITLAAFVEEYLEMHEAAPVTIAKLRWLLGKAISVIGERRLAELSPRDVYMWRLTVPEGHRYEATQALRQVLNRAVAWGLLDYNPAKRGVANPQRRAREKRPFETWQQVEAVAALLGPVDGPMVIFGAATGLRPSELFGLDPSRRRSRRRRRLRPPRLRERPAHAHKDQIEHPRRAAAGEGARRARPSAGVG